VVSETLNCRAEVAISSASSSSSGPPNATRDSNRVRVRVAPHHARRSRASRPARGGPASEARGEDPRRPRASANLMSLAGRAVGRGRGWRRLRPTLAPRQDDHHHGCGHEQRNESPDDVVPRHPGESEEPPG